MIEQNPFVQNPGEGQAAPTEGVLSPEAVGNMLAEQMDTPFDLIHDLDLGRINEYDLDASLGFEYDKVIKETDKSTPDGLMRLGVASAVFQGATRTAENQGPSAGNQPLSEIIDQNGAVSDKVKSILHALFRNKATMVRGLPPGDNQARMEFAIAMKQSVNSLARLQKDPSITDADKTAIGLGFVFSSMASAESWNRSSFNDIIEKDITPCLTFEN